MSSRFWRSISLPPIAAVFLLGANSVQASDLVYTPVVPCRIANTRLAGGSLAPGDVRDFRVTGSGLQGQGGEPLGCGVPQGEARAAVINFVAVNPTGVGNLRAWAYSEPGVAPPEASIINFTTGVTIANGTVVPLCDSAATTCTFDIKIRADGNGAHLVADVVGFFGPPADLQQRVASPCPPGSAIRAIAENGGVICEADDVGTGDITEVRTSPGSGLTGGVLSGIANLAVSPSDFNGADPITASHVASDAIVIGSVYRTLTAVTVSVPAGATSGGHVAVIGVANGRCTSAIGSCPSSPSSSGRLGWSMVAEATPQNPRDWAQATASSVQPVLAIDQFKIDPPGPSPRTYTFYLRASCSITGGVCNYNNVSTVAFFIPG